MTEVEIEAVARLYCRKLGLDPDTVVFSSGGAWIPRGALMWRIKSRQVREAIAMTDAIAEVRATVTEDGA